MTWPPALSSAAVYASDAINLIGVLHIYTRRVGWEEKEHLVIGGGWQYAPSVSADERRIMEVCVLNGTNFYLQSGLCFSLQRKSRRYNC